MPKPVHEEQSLGDRLVHLEERRPPLAERVCAELAAAAAVAKWREAAEEMCTASIAAGGLCSRSEARVASLLVRCLLLRLCSSRIIHWKSVGSISLLPGHSVSRSMVSQFASHDRSR